jgi:hypothetical protein
MRTKLINYFNIEFTFFINIVYLKKYLYIYIIMTTKKLITEELNKRTFSDGSEKTTIKLTKDKKKEFDIDDIRQLSNKLQEKNKKSKYCIVGMTPLGLRTLKGFDSEYIDDDIIDEYYRGYVKSDAKLKKISYFVITKLTPPPK